MLKIRIEIVFLNNILYKLYIENITRKAIEL